MVEYICFARMVFPYSRCLCCRESLCCRVLQIRLSSSPLVEMCKRRIWFRTLSWREELPSRRIPVIVGWQALPVCRGPSPLALGSSAIPPWSVAFRIILCRSLSIPILFPRSQLISGHFSHIILNLRSLRLLGSILTPRRNPAYHTPQITHSPNKMIPHTRTILTPTPSHHHHRMLLHIVSDPGYVRANDSSTRQPHFSCFALARVRFLGFGDTDF